MAFGGQSVLPCFQTKPSILLPPPTQHHSFFRNFHPFFNIQIVIKSQPYVAHPTYSSPFPQAEFRSILSVIHISTFLFTSEKLRLLNRTQQSHTNAHAFAKMFWLRWEARWAHVVSVLDSGAGALFVPWPGALCCVLGQDSLLSRCLSPARSINGYRRIYCCGGLPFRMD